MDDTEVQQSSGVTEFQNTYGPMLTDLAKAVTRLGKLKTVDGQLDKMNFVALRKQIEDITGLSSEVGRQVNLLAEQFSHFRVAASESDQREWADLFRASLPKQWTVEGDFPQFLIFPIEVRVDLSQEQVVINKKTTRNLHPKAVAAAVDRELTRLYGERFNPQQFMKALLRAFDLLKAEAARNDVKTQAVTLVDVHRLLTLRAGISSYSAVQFAFDIYRFRRQDDRSLGGRQITFGASKNRVGFIIPRQGRDPEVLGSLEVTDLHAEVPESGDSP